MASGDVYTLRNYGDMIEDSGRFTPWHEALRRHVHPDSVVLDLGCGAGIMAFLACRYGARKVYAIEPDSSIEVAQLCATTIPGAERITWMRGLSTEITLPEPVDIVVGDLHGNLPFFSGNLNSMADVRQRHLRPGGVLLPSCDRLYAVPASAPWEVETIDSPWRGNSLQLDLTPALPFLVNTFWRARGAETDAEHLLAKPAYWGLVDYRTEKDNRGLDRTLEWTCTRDGKMDGLYIWFDGEVDEGLSFSNSPLLPELAYGRAFFPLQRSIDVEAGDHIHTRLAVHRLHEDWVYRWDTRITTPDGTPRADFRQSTFRMLPSALDGLRKSEPGYLPTLGESGRIQQAILERMDGQTRLDEIASELLRRFPQTFREHGQALAEVIACSRRHG